MGSRKRGASIHTSPGPGIRPIVITTLATQNYLGAVRRCLELLDQHAPIAYLGAVGAVPCDALAGLERVGCYTVPAGMLDRGLGNPGNGCIQHGNWLPYIPDHGGDEVIICIDGDVKMQRPFSADERAWLEAWPDGAVGIGPNEPKAGGDNMTNELVRIRPLQTFEETAQLFYPDAPLDRPPPIGNAGCIVATKRTWVALWFAYLRRWMETAPRFAHIAVQQWTLNLCINEGFDRVVLPQSFHTHGHWGYPGPPADGWGYDNVATWDGETILFAHKTW